MKTIFIKHLPRLQRWRLVAAASALLLLVSMGSVARAETFFTLRELLGSHFQNSAHVGYARIHPDARLSADIQRRTRSAAKAEYVVYVARSGERIDGYALFDQERGQHEMIDIATFFDASGHVTDVEVVAYREAYGDGIRSSRFRHQFVGRDASSSFSAGRDVDVVAGATLSSDAMTRAVARATLVVRAALQQRASVAHR
ncbi:MAG: FMN-binding protein [Deltaproteobacteria bacterium]|nr:FMN-binding protein [Deltaproteobacteria bacterium]